MIEVNLILKLQNDSMVQWHKHLLTREKSALWGLFDENVKLNFLLWHEKDIVLVTGINLLRFVEAKRGINRYNQARNNAMRKIDE